MRGMPESLPHRMLVVHNDPGTGGELRTIEARDFQRYAFGSLLTYACEVYERVFQQRIIRTSTLRLPGEVPVYERAQLSEVSVGEHFDSVICHLNLDHGGVVTEEFLAELRERFLKPDGVLLNPVRDISKKEVARTSSVPLETESAPCVVKKDDNYNHPETVLRLETQDELDAWRGRTSEEDRKGLVMHKLLRYFGSDSSGMHQLERWIVVFDDLTVNHRASNEFFIKSATSLSYYVRDERRMSGDLKRLSETGYEWKGRSIDCAYDSDGEAWDARRATLEECRSAFGFHYAELDVIRPSKNEFVVIDVNQTPGPSYKNVFFRELAARQLAVGLGIDLGSLPALAKEAHDVFLLAETSKQAGELEPAHAAYKKRAAMEGGDAEERFVAQLEAGRLAMRLESPEPVVLSELLSAFMLRPSRAEPLYELTCYFRKRKNYAMAALFAKAGVETKRPQNDHLAVLESIYSWRLLDELGVATSWIGDRVTAREAWQEVLQRAESGLHVSDADVQRIRDNLALVSK